MGKIDNPLAGRFATSARASVWSAPGRLSMTMRQPSLSEISVAMIRAMASGGGPGVVGTTMRMTSLAGNGGAALVARAGRLIAAESKSPRTIRRREIPRPDIGVLLA